VVELTNATSGKVEVLGETWNFVSDKELKLNDLCTVQAVEGLIVRVSPKA
jgi:membrane protein implicated in regulation of membrane protease activity